MVLQIILPKEILQAVLTDGELSFNDRFLCLIRLHTTLGTITQNESQCPEQDGFTRPGLARHNGQTRINHQVEPIDQYIIANGKLLKHEVTKLPIAGLMMT